MPFISIPILLNFWKIIGEVNLCAVSFSSRNAELENKKSALKISITCRVLAVI